MAKPNVTVERGIRHKLPLALALLCAAIAATLAYNLFRAYRTPAPRVQGRTIYDFYATWRCSVCGHQLDDRGAEGTRPCPQCGADMYICIPHACPQHGALPVLYLYDAESKHGDPTRIRVADGAWIPYLDENYDINIRCPRCGRDMIPAERYRPASATNRQAAP